MPAKRRSPQDQVLDRMRRAEMEFRSAKAQTDSMLTAEVAKQLQKYPKPPVPKKRLPPKGVV